jgi:type IV pilus assembly protein PilV
MLKTYKSVAGFNMLEMLVAIIVLSVGLIGVATLQMRGQQFNYVAYIRTQATFLAYDLMDRMRINQNKDIYVQNYSNIPRDCPSEGTCESQACGPADLAQYDMAEWCRLLDTLLPKGEATIANGDVLGQYRITIFWDEGESCKNRKEACKQTWIF